MHKRTNIILGGLVGTTVLSGAVLTMPQSHAEGRVVSSSASVTVSSTCSMTGTIQSGDEHTATIVNGGYELDIGKTTLKSFCNDESGYAIYAIGYTGNTDGQTMLRDSTLGSTYDITSTGGTSPVLDGSISNWAMKLTAAGSSYVPTVQNNFDSYHQVPNTYVKVAKYNNATDDSTTGTGSWVETTYAASVKPDQPAGTYVGQVKYVLVHPSMGAAPNAHTMQTVGDWATELLVGDETTAVDTRDNKTYTVARLCTRTDGTACANDDFEHSQLWMTQNLDHVIDTTRTYSHADTDLGYTTGDTTATWQPNATLATPGTISAFNSGTTEGVVSGFTSSNNNNPYQVEGGDTYAWTNGSSNTIYTSLAQCELYHSESECLHYHVGNYYNWSAAVATNNTSSYTADPTTAPDSICPAGWRLPKGLTMDGSTVVESEFNTLFRANGITNGSDTTLGTSGTNVGYASGGFSKMVNKPFYFVRSGYVNSTTLNYFGTIGVYWSSSAQSSSYAYYLSFNSSYLYPAYRYNRGSGWSVRCVAR